MNINDLEPGNPVIIPKGLDIQPKKKGVSDKPVVKPKPEERVLIDAVETKAVMYNGNDLNQVIVTILQCLSDISAKKYYGATTLVDVLRGSQSKKIQDGGLDAINGYNALSGLSRDDLAFVIEWLISNGYILQTKGLYPVLHPTNKGINYSENMTNQKLYVLKRALEKPSA